MAINKLTRRMAAFHSLFIIYLLLFTACESKAYNRIQSGIRLDLDSVKKKIVFYDQDIVKVSVTKNNEFKKESLAVIKDADHVNLSIYDENGKIIVKSDELILKVDEVTGQIQYMDLERNTFIREHDDIKPILKDTTIYDQKYYSIQQAFNSNGDEAIYGLGQFQNGIMNFKGKDILLVQDNKISIVPMLVSTKNYGILWDNYSQSEFHDGGDGTWFTGEVADQIDYYFMSGENMDDVISEYRTLTGKAPLFPKKAYGFWQCKERYTSFDELHEVVKKYRDNNIPLDNIVQDWRYWGDNSKWSSMYFEPEHFPNPTENIQQLHESNVNLMVSIWPAAGKDTRLYKELEEKDLFLSPRHFSGGKIYDAYSEEAREIYWKHVKNGLVKHGVDAFWMDGTEPQFINLRSQELFKKEYLEAENVVLGPVAQYLNTYALVTSEGLYKSFREHVDKRAFILTRSSWAGQQRNATVTWSGDVAASFETLKKQITGGINFCMAGVPYWTHDIGAFFPGGFGGLYYGGIDQKAYQELYVRWFQFGAFSPIFRSHGTGTPREVWQFKDRNPEYYRALIKTDELRYRLLPYIYGNAWQITNNDYTIMRGLPMDFPKDKKVYHIGDQYMFGPSLMIKPVTKEMFYHVDAFPALLKGDDIVENSNGKGISLKIYKDMQFKEKVASHKQGVIDNRWIIGVINPPSINQKNYSAIYECQIQTDEAGIHEIVMEATDAIRLTIGDEIVINEWEKRPLGRLEGKVTLEPGKIYDLKVETFQTKETNTIKLGWIKPSERKGEITLDQTETAYLPKGSGWYDFWTNQYHEGGQEISRKYTISNFPLYVKEGSILPMKPVQQYVDQIPDAPVYLRIYKGANAEFILYEDEGDTYNYEKGDYSEIPISWDEQEKKLTIGKRKGEYPGMIKERKFKIVWVKENHGAGIKPVKNSDKEITYNGEHIEIMK